VLGAQLVVLVDEDLELSSKSSQMLRVGFHGAKGCVNGGCIGRVASFMVISFYWWSCRG
jgi:hypothetical protein